MLGRTASLIHQLFVVTSEESRREADDLLANIADHGGEADSWETIENLVRKCLGSRLNWRNAQAQDQEKARQAATATAYSDYLDKARPSWTKRW